MKRSVTLLLLLLCAVFSGACAISRPVTRLESVVIESNPVVLESKALVLENKLADGDRGQVGAASFYHPGLIGRRTASGDPYNDRAMTAAHRTLSLGTRVRVTNLDKSKYVVVRINDRGPYVRGRIIDLSGRAARALGFVRKGTARVRVEPIT